MSLFGTLQLASNTLQAMQVGLHVVSNNIANANTPGYIREETIFAPAPVQKRGNLVLGLGVEIAGIVQQADRFLQDRLRTANSDTAGAAVQEKAFADLEALVGELGDADISTSLSDFFNSIDAVIESPGDVSLRNLVVLRGQSLTRGINRLYTRSQEVHEQFDTRVQTISSDINRLAEEVRVLNVRISAAEGGGASNSEAGALRTQRDNALSSLGKLVNISTAEQPTGAITVSIGGEFLVNDGLRREVDVEDLTEGELKVPRIRFVDNGSPLEVVSGELGGVYEARDGIVGDFLGKLDQFAGTLAFEFNRIYSQGQGQFGFTSLDSAAAATSTTAALDEAGLPFTPTNGAFDLIVRNTNTRQVQTHTIHIDLNGLDDDTSLEDLAASIDAITGIAASVTANGRLHIQTEGADSEFAFARDNTGVLAALGVNTFFTGSTAGDINVDTSLLGIQNAGRFAASATGIGEDTYIAEQLANFYERPLDALGGASIADQYTQMINDLSQGATVAKSVADGLRQFGATLEGEHLSISGVSVDEEVIKMIELQHTFQASARVVSAISELLDTLVNM